MPHRPRSASLRAAVSRFVDAPQSVPRVPPTRCNPPPLQRGNDDMTVASHAHRPRLGRAATHLLRTGESASVTIRTFGSGPDVSVRDVTSTHAQMVRRGMSLARLLASELEPGARVLVACSDLQTYVHAMLGCLLSGTVAVPLPEPRTPLQRERCRSANRDCGASLALIDPDTPPSVRKVFSSLGVATFPVPADLPEDDYARERPPSPGDLAYLQYTSGSTPESSPHLS